jgi:KDO2-lipid IV(A) lauroyltransferase
VARPWACCPTRCRPKGWASGRPFLAADAYTMTLAARLAQQTGAAVVLARCERLPWGRGFVMYCRAFAAPLDEDWRPPCAGQRGHGTPDSPVSRAVPVGLCRYKQPREPKPPAGEARHDGRLGVWFMGVLAHVPLPGAARHGLAAWAGAVCAGRAARKVALRNLELCFPQATRLSSARSGRARLCGVLPDLAGPQLAVVRPARWCSSACKLQGAVHELEGDTPTIIFAPHFYGMDAGGLALPLRTSARVHIHFFTHPDPVLTPGSWPGASALAMCACSTAPTGSSPSFPTCARVGCCTCCPTWTLGAGESIFVPFYGVPTATVPSLSRFARLGRAKVIGMYTRLTPMATWPS